MKKIIAIVMALVMMMAVAVPAFAGELNGTVNNGDTTVIVDGTSGIGDGTYSVTIPAAVNLTWGNDGADEYSITSQLVSGKRVKVTLAKTKDLTSAANNVIAFTATDATSGLSQKEVVKDEVHAFNITIADGAWDLVPYDVYEGLISFSSEVVDA